MKNAKETLDSLLGWKDAVIPEPPETISYENCINFMEFYASQTDDLTNSEIKDLNSFDAYLIKAANAKVGFRFKVKELKRVINTIINQAEVSEESIELDPSHVKSYGNGYR